MKQFKFVFDTVLAGILWGCISLFLKNLSFARITNIQVLAAKAVIVVIFQAIFILVTNRRNFKIKIKDLWIFAGTGILSVTFFQICYFKSILELGASTSVILLYTSPIWVMLLSRIIFREKFTLPKIIALAITFAGCILLSGIGGKNSISITGFAIGILSGIGYALYSIFGRFALNKYSSSTLVFYTFLLNGIALVPFSHPAALVASLTWKSGLLLLGIAILCTAIPYFLYSYGLSGLENSQAAIFATVEPLVGCLIGIIVWHETVTAVKIIGIILILVAMILIGWPEKKARK